MNLRDLERRGSYRSTSTTLGAYFHSIGRDFCVYLRPAIDASALYLSQYSEAFLTDIGRGRLDAGLLSVAVVHTEWLRQQRRSLADAGNTRAATLLCDNIMVMNSEQYDWRTAKNVVDWPHFILKHIYSRVGVMFGKFWTHEETESLDGRQVPPPPTTFLSVRNAIVLRDPRLLKEQFDVAATIERANDSGENVLSDALGRPIEIDTLTAEVATEMGLYDFFRSKLEIR